MSGMQLSGIGSVFAASAANQTFVTTGPYRSVHVRTDVAVYVSMDVAPTSTSFVFGPNEVIMLAAEPGASIFFKNLNSGDTGSIRFQMIGDDDSDGGESPD